jgi:hypothetical protein
MSENHSPQSSGYHAMCIPHIPIPYFNTCTPFDFSVFSIHQCHHLPLVPTAICWHNSQGQHFGPKGLRVAEEIPTGKSTFNLCSFKMRGPVILATRISTD